jgi:hypothetical protein
LTKKRIYEGLSRFWFNLTQCIGNVGDRLSRGVDLFMESAKNDQAIAMTMH